MVSTTAVPTRFATRRVLVVTAISVGLLGLVLAANWLRPGALPTPSRGERIVAECPADGSPEYFFPAGNLSREGKPDGASAFIAQWLKAANAAPLWCGDRANPVYRFMLLFDWGKTKVVTIRQAGSQWLLEGVEFQHSAVARFVVERRVSRLLTVEEVAMLMAAFENDNVWMLPSREPESGNMYSGPVWFLEGRATTGYHRVMRASNSEQIAQSGRLFLQLAGLPGHQNHPPQQPAP